jgi:hypothetical protein
MRPLDKLVTDRKGYESELSLKSRIRVENQRVRTPPFAVPRADSPLMLSGPHAAAQRTRAERSTIRVGQGA